jgi:hypothetical protein
MTSRLRDIGRKLAVLPSVAAIVARSIGTGTMAMVRSKIDEDEALISLLSVTPPEDRDRAVTVAKERVPEIEQHWNCGLGHARRLDSGGAYETPLAAAYRSVYDDITSGRLRYL